MSGVTEVIKTLRRNFDFVELNEENVQKNPLAQFELWMKDAVSAEITEPNAMTLATVGAGGFPNARIVLLRDFDKNGFTFFTNYKSAKAKELAGKKACLNFFWRQLSRQVRIKGKVKKLLPKQSDAYFNTRPRESQIGAWVSPQSEVIEERNFLEQQYYFFDQKFKEKKIPRPPHWGGYIVEPMSIEFWQGRPNRLHDRLLYIKQTTGKWKIARLAP